jgi:hypothetical protein
LVEVSCTVISCSEFYLVYSYWLSVDVLIMMRRLAAILALSWAALAACDKPPLPAPSTPSADAIGAKKSARPALQKSGLPQALGSALGSDDSTAIVEDGGDDADADATNVAAEASTGGGEDRSAFISQLFTLGLVLLMRLGLAAWKSMRARGVTADSLPGAAALASVQAALYSSPFGPALTAVGQLWAKVAEFARSPNAAPVMLGLVIVSMKLVKRMEPPDEEEPLVVQATAESEDAAADEADAEGDESDGDVAMEAAAEEAEEEEEVEEEVEEVEEVAEELGAEDEEEDDPYD